MLDKLKGRCPLVHEAIHAGAKGFLVHPLGLKGGKPGQGAAAGLPVVLKMTAACEASQPLMQAAIAASQSAQELVCGVVIEPSTAPASMVLLHNGQELPMEVHNFHL